METEDEEFIEVANRIKDLAHTMLAVDDADFPRRSNGLLDPLGLVRSGDLSEHDVNSLLRGPRSGVGLTAKEINARDYTNFPWHCGGAWCTKSSAEPTPMFWEKTVDSKRRLVVAFSNGHVRRVDQEDFDRMIAAVL